MTRFVILAVPRTGSNLLCTLLNSHPRILCHHEVFNPQGVFAALDYHGNELAVESLQQRDNDPLGFLDRVWQTGTDDMCTGFKWTTGQNGDVFRNVVGDSLVKKVVLQRRNRIKTYVSEKIAQETQQWEVYSRLELKMPRPRIRVDPEELLQHIGLNLRFYADLLADLARLNQPHLVIQYERLFDMEIQSRMLEFLAVAQHDRPLTAASIKQNSADLRDTIANFDELAACLENSELKDELCDRGI